MPVNRLIGAVLNLFFNKKPKFVHYPVGNSEMITHLAYCEDKQLLQVTFRNGQPYEYKGVPSEVFNGFTFTDSVGKYFNTHIKNVYNTTKII